MLVKRNLDGESVKLLGREAGIAYSLIAKWKRQYLNSGAAALENKKKPGNPLARYSRRKFLTREETLEYKIELLKRKLLKQEAEIVRLKKNKRTGRGRYLKISIQKLYALIEKNCKHYSVQYLSSVYKVSRAGYYKWLKRK